MPSVFEYANYRDFLRDYYNFKKEENPNYSYQVISDKAGFKDKSTFYGVVTGRRNISKTGIYKITKAIRFNRYESEYFENLVAFNQAKELQERNHFFEKMNSVKNYGKIAGKAKLIREDCFEFYSKWYHSAIRSLIGLYDFKDDYAWLARNLNPTITRKQAEKSVRLLERLGLIKKQADQTYKLTTANISASEEVLNVAGQNYHCEMAELAKKAIGSLTKEERYLAGLTIGVSRNLYAQICEEITQFRKKLIDLVADDKAAEMVYHLNFHLFPLSNKNILNEKKERIHEK